MSTRREWILAAVCVLGAGAGLIAKPSRKMSRTGKLSLEKNIPEIVGSYQGNSFSDMLAGAEPGSLTDRLYDQTVARRYRNQKSGQIIDMLVAHGPDQSNENQLHRPEVCYPAFGYQILASKQEQIALGRGGQLPARELHTSIGDRKETIIYWTRLGDSLPTSGSEQRLDRVKLALHGIVADGVLVRFSSVDTGMGTSSREIQNFIKDFVTALSPQVKVALLGEHLAPGA